MTYEDNYLAHYGITGQKWGVRRFQNEDGTLTAAGKIRYGLNEEGGTGNKKYSKAFYKEASKLSRAKDRADIDLQRKKAEGFGKKAKIAGRVAGAAGVSALAAWGANPHLSNLMLGKADKIGKERASVAEDVKNAYKLYAESNAADFRNSLGGPTVMSDKTVSSWNEYQDKIAKREKLLNDEEATRNKASALSKGLDIAQKVALGVTAGAGATAAYYKTRELIAKHRTTQVGHLKAVEKYEAQYKKMMNMFADTPYADLIKKSA